MRKIDKYNLYGKAAYPKTHKPEQAVEFYQLAERLDGVFVNPALVEPFGLTILEATASGIPVVATKDGGLRRYWATAETVCWLTRQMRKLWGRLCLPQ